MVVLLVDSTCQAEGDRSIGLVEVDIDLVDSLLVDSLLEGGRSSRQDVEREGSCLRVRSSGGSRDRHRGGSEEGTAVEDRKVHCTCLPS